MSVADCTQPSTPSSFMKRAASLRVPVVLPSLSVATYAFVRTFLPKHRLYACGLMNMKCSMYISQMPLTRTVRLTPSASLNVKVSPTLVPVSVASRSEITAPSFGNAIALPLSRSRISRYWVKVFSSFGTNRLMFWSSPLEPAVLVTLS